LEKLIARGSPWVLGSAVLLPLATALTFWWVPDDAYDGFTQKIFYIHVPVALTGYACFLYGAVSAVAYLRTRDPAWDLRSYVGIHVGTIFGTLVLVTGPIWARASWGVWWDWSDKQLNVFLVLFLFYCAYFMLRFSIEEGERRAAFSAVYVLLGIGLVPLSFLAIRIAQAVVHPEVFTRNGAAMPGSFLFTFCVSLAGMLCLAAAMIELELAGKQTALRLRELRRRLAGADL
jgi:heme exporter protein C